MSLQQISGSSSYDPMMNSTSVVAQISKHPQTAENSAENEDNKPKAVGEGQVKLALEQANEKLKFTRTRCELTYHDDINRVAIKVIDRDTDEVIREIPTEETIALVQKLWEMAGIIIDEKR